VDTKLKEPDLFQDQDPEMMQWRSTIHDKLQELAGGDFFKVDNVLGQINVVVGSGAQTRIYKRSSTRPARIEGKLHKVQSMQLMKNWVQMKSRS
jgi:hypothetical protein